MTKVQPTTQSNSTPQPPTLAQAATRLLLGLLAAVLVALHIIGLFYYPAFAATPVPDSPLQPDNIRLALSQLGLTFDWYVAYWIGLDVFNTLANLTLACLLLWRKANDWFGLYLSAMLVLGISVPYSLSVIWPSAFPVVQVFEAAGVYLFFFIFYLFPNGRFVPGWTRWLSIFYILFFLGFIFFPEDPSNSSLLDAVLSIAFVALLLTGIASQIYRYWRVSSPTERQQTKWPVFFFILWVVRALILVLPPPMQVIMREGSLRGFLLFIFANTSSYLLMAMAFAGLVIAILRYRLWDIDLIIRRTVLWAIISGLGLGVYLLAVGATSFFLGSQPDYVIPLVALVLVALIAKPFYGWLEVGLERLWPSHKETSNEQN